MPTKLLLIGATGRTGRLIADALLREPDVELTALVRRSDHVLPGAKVLQADLAGDFSTAFQGITHVIYAAGSVETDTEIEEEQIDRDAVARSAEHAKVHHVEKLLVISALSAYWPERSIESLRHYSQMKREGDDLVIASGVDYVILRPGMLSDGPAAGTIGITDTRLEDAPPVSREDVARTTIEAIKLGISRRIIGFVGGNVPIRQALQR